MKIIIGPSFLELNSDDFHFFKSLFSSSRSRDRILEEKNIRFWTHCGWCTQTVPKHLRISIVWPDWKKYPVPLYGNYTFIKWIQCSALHCNDRNVSLDSPKEKTDHIALYFIIINTELTWISSSQSMFQHPCEDYFSCPRDEYLDALYKTILDLQGIPRPRSELLPLLLGTNTTPLQEHKSQCNVFRLGTFTKKGPATLNGLVKLRASRVPGAPGGLA